MHKAEMKAPILVAASIILGPEDSEGVRRILIARRQFDARAEAGKWEFPGGKVEPLEHPELTVVREIKEELGLNVKVERIFDVASHVSESDLGPVHVILLCYLCSTTETQFQLLDASDAKWVTIQETDQFDFAIADHEPLRKLKAYFLGQSS